MAKIIELNRGFTTVVDDADYDFLMQWKWYVLDQGRRKYVVANIKQPDGKYKTQYMHKMLIPAPKNMRVIHDDKDGLNNQRSNLFIAHQSALPKFKAHTSAFKGVRQKTYRYVPKMKPRARRPWEASIKILGKSYVIGSFATEAEAAAAYDRTVADVYGRYGFQNCRALNMGSGQVFYCPDDTYRKIMEDGRVVVVARQISMDDFERKYVHGQAVTAPPAMAALKRASAKRNKTGFCGVKEIKMPKGVFYEAYIRDGLAPEKKYLGRFTTAADAARAYDRAALTYHGRSAYLNFPEEHFKMF